MTDILPFDFDGTQVRVITDEHGEPWWLAADVTALLGYSNGRDALSRIPGRMKGSVVISDGTPGNPNRATINEAGLNRLIMRSNLPEAERFQDWIAEDVLPSIRRHGGYLTPETVEQVLLNPDTIIRLATDLKAEREQRQVLAAKVEEDAPKVLFADSVSAADSTILVGDLAKILRGNGVNIGANRLFSRLREDGYLIRREGTDWNMPTQRAMDLGLFRVKETAITHADGHVTISKTPKVTGKGQTYLVAKYISEAQLTHPLAQPDEAHVAVHE